MNLHKFIDYVYAIYIIHKLIPYQFYVKLIDIFKTKEYNLSV